MANEYGIPSTVDTAVLSMSLSDYQKRLTDQVYNRFVLWRKINENGNKKLINGGLSIVEPLIKAKQNNGGFYLGASVLNNTQDNTTNLLEYKWQNAYEPIVITRDEERQNSGDMHKIIDLVGAKIKLSELAIGDRMEQASSLPVADAGNFCDIDTIVNTGALGNLTGTTDTFWQATVTTSGAFATQGLTDMQTAFQAVSSSANVDNPDLIITTKAVYNKFWATRLPLERITNGEETANAGKARLTFNGETVDYGNYITSGYMYFLNTNYLYLAVDSETDLITTPFITPANQTIKVAYILWRGNLITNNRRRNAKLTNIT